MWQMGGTHHHFLGTPECDDDALILHPGFTTLKTKLIAMALLMVNASLEVHKAVVSVE